MTAMPGTTRGIQRMATKVRSLRLERAEHFSCTQS